MQTRQEQFSCNWCQKTYSVGSTGDQGDVQVGGGRVQEGKEYR